MANRPDQCAADVLLIRPEAFGPNPETAATNAFQQSAPDGIDEIRSRALAEFDGLVAALRQGGLRVLVFPDTADPPKPDAVFPNNWLSLHADGTVVLYPMAAVNRRAERRLDIIEALRDQYGYRIGRVLDLSPLEELGWHLEGTGSMVFDHANRVAYAALSPRTHPRALEEFARQMDFEVIAFSTSDAAGQPVYHTNVVMSIGEDFAVLCTDALTDHRERRQVLQRLQNGGRRVIPISAAQMHAFAGNILQLRKGHDARVIVMSATARQAFTAEQLTKLGADATIIDVPLRTIESAGGGSARCMIAEIFLPRVE